MALWGSVGGPSVLLKARTTTGSDHSWIPRSHSGGRRRSIRRAHPDGEADPCSNCNRTKPDINSTTPTVFQNAGPLKTRVPVG
eukprot:5053425-Pyramimonas_sp.AAC.1